MGVISSGIKEGKTSSTTAAEAIAVMSMLNRSAAEAMTEVGVGAATDVTGFGLIGHLLEMLEDRLDADLRFGDIPVLAEAFDLAGQGVVPGGSKRNLEAMGRHVDSGSLDVASRTVLFDAQTSGGLLIAVEENKTDALLSALGARGVQGHNIGRVRQGSGHIVIES
jgi:selenide,water dikinase